MRAAFVLMVLVLVVLSVAGPAFTQQEVEANAATSSILSVMAWLLCPAIVAQPLVGVAQNLRPLSGRVLFISDYEGLTNDAYTREIYSMMLDGSDLRRLTFNTLPEWSASWSPNGTQILFESDTEIESQMYVMDADGSNVRSLDINLPANSPVWAPTSDYIAFASMARPGISDIVVASLDGSSVVRITDGTSWNAHPTWFPDGSRIAFASDRTGNLQLFVINRDGTGLQQLTTSDITHDQPSWSPDGNVLAFVSDGPTADRPSASNIYLLNLRSGLEVQLTEEQSDGANQPSWSPDGRYILFRATELDMTTQIYALEIASGERVRITDFRATSDSPSWQPRNADPSQTRTFTPTSTSTTTPTDTTAPTLTPSSTATPTHTATLTPCNSPTATP